MKAKNPKTFRLTDEAVIELQRMAVIEGKSQTEVVEGLILGTIRGGQLGRGSQTAEGGEDQGQDDSQLVAALRQQIDMQTGTIKTLQAALTSSQEATKAALALHAQTIAATSIPTSTDLSTTPTTASSSPRPGLWARIRDAFRG